MNLVAFLGKDKENWGQLTALINRGGYEKIILVKDRTTENFPASPITKLISIDLSESITQVKEKIQDKLRNELSKEFEVALSLASGNGKEHMALVSALLSVPVGIKLVAYTKEGVEFLS